MKLSHLCRKLMPHTISATLSQNGRPVAFFSRSLYRSERHSSIEKEAYAIIESIRKWRHYLATHHFTLFTDQRSVAFMFDKGVPVRSKMTILRWRIELGSFSFNIQYRPGKENILADTLSRVQCSAMTTDNLVILHTSLCHPGVTRFSHFVQSKNLPYSTDEVKKIVSSCSTVLSLNQTSSNLLSLT